MGDELASGSAPAPEQRALDVLLPRSPKSRLERWLAVGLASVGIAWIVIRFVALEYSPRGFFSDEFRAALHLVCLGETGRTGYGQPWPLFVPGAGGGFYTAPFLYFGVVWVKLFGHSIASVRAIAATFTVLAIVALYGFVRRIAGRELAFWAALLAALSPWSFQFSRIAWDPPLAPAFLMLALWAWLGRRAVASGLLSGGFFALALYAYPPMRIQAPLVFGALFASDIVTQRFRWRTFAAFGVSSTVIAVPLLQETLKGALNQRAMTEAVFAPAFVTANQATDTPAWFILRVTLENLAAHFRPSFLFFSGDANRRSSTQSIGELGLLDDLAVLVGIMLALRLLHRGGADIWQGALGGQRGSRGERWALLFAGFAFLAGVLPAALCFTGVPHALRSNGAWPFLAIVLGLVLSRWTRGNVPALAATALVAAVHSAYFAYAYFGPYRAIEEHWFSVDIQRALSSERLATPEAHQVTLLYPEGFRYYRILLDRQTCIESERSLIAYLSGR